jgi:TatD DNase family protein
MIDSHCHLDHEPLLENLIDVINRSKEVGITKLLTICTTLDSFERIKKIIEKDKIIYGTFGIHPHETENDLINKQTIIKAVKENNKIIGIGETGLDFFYNHSNKNRQINSFKEHIEASIELNRPIIIHSRNAEIETFDILNSYKNNNLKILMHCFTGTQEFSKKLMTLNSFFSASGIITFKNTTDLQNTFKNIPIEKLLIETDSPFLAPIPMRGKKNEPSFIKYTLEKLSILKETTVEQMSDITTGNFNKLFNV